MNALVNNMEPAAEPRTRRENAGGFRSAWRFPWTPAEDALLGKAVDSEVAEKLNRKLGAVRDRRKFLGKPAWNHTRPAYVEREPRDHYTGLFANKSDRELRALLGWSYRRIHTRRRQLAARKVRQRQPEWTPEEDALLGTMPDAVLARKLGRTAAAVRARRGVKRIRVKKDWRPEDDKVLGTRKDREIAMLLGRHKANVAWRRKKLGIPAKAKLRPWTAEEEALLGSKPDKELANLFGRTVLAVVMRRRALGRPKPDPQPRVFKPCVATVPGKPNATAGNVKPGAYYCTWTVEEDALVGTMTDEEAARKLGCSVARVRRRRHLLGRASNNSKHRHWMPGEIALLGTRPDGEVARLVNRSVANVRCKRLALGIPFQNARYEIWKPDEVALLGKLPDEEVAARTGHSLVSVRRARDRRGILSVQRVAPDWRPEEDAMLGTGPDETIAKQLNRTAQAVRHRRVIKGVPACPDPRLIVTGDN